MQQLRHAVVAPTGMGIEYGRIMPMLRQGWLVKQKILQMQQKRGSTQAKMSQKWIT